MSITQSFSIGNYNITNTPRDGLRVCFDDQLYKAESPWQMANPMLRSIPSLATELSIAIVAVRLFILILKPLHQPRFVSELMASLLIGPVAYGSMKVWAMSRRFSKELVLFPFEITVLLETFANLGLTFYMFLVGLEMDVSTIKRMEKKSLSIAFAGVVIPFCIGAVLHFIPFQKDDRLSPNLGALFWAITLTLTSFPDLARILSDVKLLHTEIGKTALSSAIINDLTAWFLLVFVIIIFNNYTKDSHGPAHAELGSIITAALPIICFVLICWVILRPCIAWMIRETKRKVGKFDDSHICVVILGVIVCGFITDACGTHSLVGGFILGLIIPNGEFAINIMERTEEFVTGFWLPGFIIVSGLRTNLFILFSRTKLIYLLLTTIVAISSKILSTVLVGLYYGMPLRDGVSLGGLMNTKGVMALVVLNEGRSLQAIDSVLFAAMVFIVLLMTGLVGPIFSIANKKAKRSRKYKQRTIQRSNPDTEFRILTCIHSVGNLSGIINLLEVSNAREKSPMCIFAVHLVELTRRASAMLIVHDAFRTKNSDSDSTQELVDSDLIINAFRNYAERNKDATVQPLTAVSSFTSIHEDIFNIAEDKLVALILIPFHKQPTADGELQGDNHQIRQVNLNLLAKAPCSVGLLVDRGIGSAVITSLHSSVHGRMGLKFCTLFIGGPDDREALYYAWRMAGKSGVKLTVVRYIHNKDGELDSENNNEEENLADISQDEKDKELDDEFINEFRFKSMCDSSITYNEKMVSNAEGIVESITTMYNEFELYIVGRGENVKSPLTKGLSEWSDNPELGPVGEILLSTNSTAQASILVVQQSSSRASGIGSQRFKTKFGEQKWASPILNPDFAEYENERKKVY